MTISKENKIYNTIGKNIQKYRKQKGFTQAKLAEILDFSENFIAKLESKTPQSLSIISLWEIANALDIPVGNFYDESINEENIEKKS